MNWLVIVLKYKLIYKNFVGFGECDAGCWAFDVEC